MPVNLSPLAGAGWQFSDNNGTILAGGLLYTYAAGTTTPLATYTSSSGGTVNTNPIVLDAAGRTANETWLTEGSNYKFIIKDSSNVLIGTYDNISGINDVSSQFTIYTDLANTTNVAKGDALIGFCQSNSAGIFGGAVGKTVHTKLQEILSVLDFGADPTGVADSTTEIQSAITAAGVGGRLHFPTGTYLLSSTIDCLVNQNLTGDGPNNTIIRRFANYGNTFNFDNAGCAIIKGMWFYHGTLPDTGFTTLTNLATTGSHIRFGNAQGALIEDCWLWRMPFQINIEQGSLIKINRCNVQGCWNRYYAAAQEGIAGIYIGAVAYAQLIDITNCYFGGSNSGAQSIPFVISDNGTQTVNFTGTNAGNQNGILVYGCEGLLIDNCYMGGNVYSNILLTPIRILSQVRITNNFFDSGGYDAPMVYILPQANGQYAHMVNIANNNFNGELMAFQSIGSFNAYGTQPTITNFQITDNTMGNNLGAAIFLRNAQGGVIADNMIAGYNSRNLTPGGDVNYCTGIYLSNSVSVNVDSNIVGGGVNSAAPSAYTYQGVLLAGTVVNVTEKNTVHNGTGTTGTIRGRVAQYTVIDSSSSNYQLLGTEETLVIINSTAAAIQVSPPTLLPIGYAFTLKDGAGNASTKPIQFIGTVDGTVNPTYSTNYFSRTLLWNGTQWNVIAN